MLCCVISVFVSYTYVKSTLLQHQQRLFNVNFRPCSTLWGELTFFQQRGRFRVEGALCLQCWAIGLLLGVGCIPQSRIGHRLSLLLLPLLLGTQAFQAHSCKLKDARLPFPTTHGSQWRNRRRIRPVCAREVSWQSSSLESNTHNDPL